MKKYLLFLSTFLLFGCGDGGNRETISDSSYRASSSSKNISIAIDVGEHKDVGLPDRPTSTYSVSSRVLSNAGNYNPTLDCYPAQSVSEYGAINYTNISYGTIYADSDSKPVIRVIGVYPGTEVICSEMTTDQGDKITYRIAVTVNATQNGDLIGGSPIDPSDPGDGGGGDNGGGGTGPPTPPDPNVPGGNAEYDPKACIGQGFFTVSDTWQTTEGQFGADGAGYVRSVMPGNVNSTVKLFYPAISGLAQPHSYSDFGRYQFTAIKANNTLVEFDLQFAQSLFGRSDNKHFYIESNGYCMRGEFPTSVMTPPNKALTWVTSN